ncbi:MAG: aspartate/glutamate racemase family protein [Pseudomonadota bacterium]
MPQPSETSAKPLHIGLIGGIGVAATVAYYQRLTAAVAARGRSLELTIVHAEAKELIRNNLADAREAQAEVYAPLIDRLARAGCDCAAITSLGGHFCFAETAGISALPLVSAVAPLDDFFAAEELGRVGLLGTEVVMRTRLYGQLERTEAAALDDRLDELGAAYLDMAMAGRCDAATREAFFAAGSRLVEEMGAEAVVLAGTDLSLAFDGREVGYRVIDALDVHVDLLARLAVGEATLEEAGSAT